LPILRLKRKMRHIKRMHRVERDQTGSSYLVSPLRAAIRRNDTQEALRLVKSKRKYPDIEEGCTNLHLAIRNCPNLELIQLLLEGRSVEIIDFASKRFENKNAMLEAALYANAIIIDHLARAGANVRVKDEKGRSPFYLTVMHGAFCANSDNPPSAYPAVLAAAKTLARHGALDALQSPKEMTLLRDYVDKNLGARFPPDTNLITWLTSEGLDPGGYRIAPEHWLAQEYVKKLIGVVYEAVQCGITLRRLAMQRALHPNFNENHEILLSLLGDYV